MMPQVEVNLAKPKISIKQDGSETIAGLATQKYRVMADGQLHEEIWVAENKALAEEAKAQMQYVKELIECRSPQTMEEMVDRDPDYEKIVVKGYIMKDVIYQSGMPVDGDEVISLKQKNIPASEFDVPAGYRRAKTLMEIWM